jgi:hypothetical protein
MHGISFLAEQIFVSVVHLYSARLVVKTHTTNSSRVLRYGAVSCTELFPKFRMIVVFRLKKAKINIYIYIYIYIV